MPHSAANTVHVVNHEYADLSIERDILARAGYRVEEAFGDTAETLLESIRDSVGIVCIYAQLNEALVSQLTACRAISRPGVGYDMIDVAACRRHGIEVSYLPSYGDGEVATHGAAMALAMHQKLLDHYRQTTAGVWDFKRVPPVKSLKVSTLGVIGLGRIGQAFLERMRPFVGEILVFDPVKTTLDLGPEVRLAMLEEIYASADIISLHCPLTAQTRHMLDAAAFARMHNNPLIINVSRGGLIDTQALIEALENGQLRGAALDVLEDEPAMARGLMRDDVLLTPHTAWRSRESEAEIRTRSSEELVRMLAGEPPLNRAP